MHRQSRTSANRNLYNGRPSAIARSKYNPHVFIQILGKLNFKTSNPQPSKWDLGGLPLSFKTSNPQPAKWGLGELERIQVASLTEKEARWGSKSF